MINTVVRQIAFYSFERHVHEERKAGELTSERLGEIWLEVQGESLGPAIELSEGYEIYWSYVPHFIHSPFYVYAYAFGDCLVNSLYGLYQEAHPGFVAKYFAMLEAGGSKHHSELLSALRPRCVQAGVLAQGPEGHRGHDRRAGARCSALDRRRQSAHRRRLQPRREQAFIHGDQRCSSLDLAARRRRVTRADGRCAELFD